MTTHSILAPSAAHRWSRCPASIQMEEDYPDNPSVYAAEGSVFHDIVAECLDQDEDDIIGVLPEDYIGETRNQEGFDIEVDSSMVKFAKQALDYAQALMHGETYIERRVDLSPWLPDDADGNAQGGTLDLGVIQDDMVVICDWKYGLGVPVSPVQNEQLILYALGFWSQYVRGRYDNITHFRLVVFQPRNASGGGVWDCTLGDLLEAGERLSAQAAKTYQVEPPIQAGPIQCQFCAAKPDCNEYHRYNLEQMSLLFEDLTEEEVKLPDTEGMTLERLSVVASHTKMIRKWLDLVNDKVYQSYFEGKDTPGVKVVPGNRGARTWADPDGASQLLVRTVGESKAYNQKLISPAQAEGMLSTRDWQDAQELITRAEPKPILVSEDDPREGMKPAISLFDDETEQD